MKLRALLFSLSIVAMTATVFAAPAADAAVKCNGGCYDSLDACYAANSCNAVTSCPNCDGCAEVASCDTGGTSSAPSASPAPGTKATLINPLGTTSIPTLLGRAVKIFTGISGSLALLMFVYGGVVWMTAGGSQEKITKGKKIFTTAVLGLVIIFGAYTILNAFFAAIGLQ